MCLLLTEPINVGLQDVGAIGKQIEDGVRLMGRGADDIKWPLHFEVYHLLLLLCIVSSRCIIQCIC